MTIQDKLHSQYQRDQWQNILEEVFNTSAQRLSLLASPSPLAAAHDNVKQTLQLGNIELDDGNTIAVLEIETTDQIKLARNRVGLRNFVTSFIDQADATAVLAVFYQADSDDWRLTYASKTTTLDEDTFEVVNIETAPKRFTYLLGKGEPCRTPAHRLAKIRDNKDEVNLKTIELAFSVESLSKDFFKKYKGHYEKFTSYLLSTDLAGSTRASFEIPTIENVAAQEKADKPVRDFVKTLLGRLVFLHFLQKKNWLSCSVGNRQWKDGDAQFLENYKQMAVVAGEGDLFHSKYLCPLFFEALNQEDRSNDLFELTNTRMPYLNGGLFEEDADEHRDIDFPIHFFAELLDFFGEYNFTIDENDPEDHEVGIDPEMLGMIFENLLEDNKEKGTYYTPKAIVSYMSRQSLLHYLQTHLGENEEIEKLLQEKDASNHTAGDSFVNQHREKIIQLLHDVTVCDPAIGSGAFPIGMLHEILWTMLTLLPEEENTSKKRAELKRQIIQNSIHGVDIDPGAIEIARLRFWLALVVDEDEPRPLPNLDYKIHRADSLIEYIRGEAVNLGTETPKDESTKRAVNELIQAKKALFTAQKRQEKRDAWFALYRSLSSLAQAEFTWLRNETNFADAERLGMLTKGIKDFGHWITQIDSIKKAKVHLQDTLLDQLRKWFDDPAKPTFLWNLHFGGTMAEGGFDIIITNPPYVSAIDHKKAAGEDYRNYIKKVYPTAAGAWDLYIPFFHLATKISKPTGASMLITPNKFLSIGYGKKLRCYLDDSTRILALIDASRIDVFKDVSVYPVISHFSNLNAENYQFSTFSKRSYSKTFRPDDFTEATFTKQQLDLLPDKLWGFLISTDIVILSKMIRNSKPINSVYDINASTTASEAELYGNSLKELTSDAPTHWKVLNTGTIDPFTSLWGLRPLRHSGNTYLSPILFRDNNDISTYRSSLYSEKKIIFAKMALRTEAYPDFKGEYAALNVNFIYNFKSDDDLIFMLSYIHSNVFQFIYNQYFGGLSMSGGYLPFQAPQMRVMPLPKKKPNTAETMLLSKFFKNLPIQNQDLLNPIFYRLFDLTPEEIDLIETTLAE